MFRLIWIFVLLASLSAGPARGESPPQRLPSALLIYPLIDTDGGFSRDTRIELLNLTGRAIDVRCFYVEGSFCGEIGFFVRLTPNQPLSWWGGPPPVFIDAVLNDKAIPIHGDGQQTRSFTYVSDTVAGIFEAIVRDQANGRVLNVGSREEVTIVELAHRIHAASGKAGSPKIEFIPYESFTGKKYEDVRRRVPDITLSRKVLDFEAVVSLDEGLTRTIEWQREATRQRKFGG